MSSPRPTRRDVHSERRLPEIQALRAVAVLYVVLFHLWPGRLPGGYAGVDIFFVISGFLITSHLLRQVTATGTVRLREFWARRARRLLPAALLVAAATTVGVYLWAPRPDWGGYFTEIIGSVFYVVNWVLASNSVDYLAADNAASPAQHYWSLSVEEQFYIVWPLLVLLAVLIARRFGTKQRVTIGVVLGAVVTASLVYSIVFTPMSPASAYFFTTTRAWEFGAGGLLALLPLTRLSPGFRISLSWLGWGLIALSALVLRSTTPFPGWAALLPVAGVVCVIYAGTVRGVLSPRPIVSLRPVQYLGDISYSLYLWHWPPIILLPFALGHSLSTVQKVVLLAVTVLLAALTKTFVEDPVRHGVLARRPSWNTYLATATSMVLVAAIAGGGLFYLAGVAKSDEQKASQLAGSSCFGAAALAPDNAALCSTDTDLGYSVLPSPETIEDDVPKELYTDQCRTNVKDSAVKNCVFAAPSGTPDAVVALVGDSHAAQWFPALQVLARERNWELHVFFKAACTFTSATLLTGGDLCTTWNTGVMEALPKIPNLTLVITSAQTSIKVETKQGETQAAAFANGVSVWWQQLVQDGFDVVAVQDSPRMSKDAIACAVQKDGTAAMLDCGVKRETALSRSGVLPSAVQSSPDVGLVDMSDFICRETFCPVVVGNVIVYRDTSSHLTQTYVTTLAPYFATKLDAVLAKSGN